MQKSIEDLDSTVKENKYDIKSLMDRTKALETQNTQKDDKIKELTDEINNTQQHQRKFSIRIKGLHDQRNKKMKNSWKMFFTYKQSNQFLNLLSWTKPSSRIWDSYWTYYAYIVFLLNFAASRNVNIQSFTILDHIINNDNQKDTNVFQNIQSIF